MTGRYFVWSVLALAMAASPIQRAYAQAQSAYLLLPGKDGNELVRVQGGKLDEPILIGDNVLFGVAKGKLATIGTIGDKAVLQNWYLGTQHHVEQFHTSDGRTLLDSKVQDLVSAMASFSVPAIGQTTLPPSYQSTLLPIIASDWGP